MKIFIIVSSDATPRLRIGKKNREIDQEGVKYDKEESGENGICIVWGKDKYWSALPVRNTAVEVEK